MKKEPGFTSHDVVAKLRGIDTSEKKSDIPEPLIRMRPEYFQCVLERQPSFVTLSEIGIKTYEAVLLLGRETDTEDTSGQTLKEREVAVTEEEIRDIILSFQGSYDQIPPMYSAKKVNGKKLYELARQGIVIERKPCPVTLSSIII